MKLLSFQPDLDDHLEGVITDCEMVEPTMKGMSGAPSLVTPAGASALPSACISTASVRRCSRNVC